MVGRLRRGREQGIDLPGIFIEQEKLLVVGAGGAQQVEAVGLGLGQSLLVAEDDLGGIVFDAAEGDESPALELASRGGGKGLGVGVDGRRGILPEDAFGAPLAGVGGGPGIYVVAGVRRRPRGGRE